MVLEQLWLDTLILGVHAVSATDGASCNHDGEAGINSLMVRRADRVIVVATGDKVGKRSFARICESSAIHVLVTDQSAPEPELEALRALGVEIVIA
jgi:DeoR family transcriptional regulator of aga operon